MNTHKKINNLLAGFALGELSERQQAQVKNHLAQCQKCTLELKRLEALLNCAGQRAQLSADNQLCESAKKAILETAESEQGKQPSTPNAGLTVIWRTIMKTRITKLATAAIIVIAFAMAIHLISSPGDLFASMLEKIELIDSFTFQHELTLKGIANMPKDFSTTLDSIVYVSDKYGIRRDMQMGPTVISIAYIPVEGNVITEVLPTAKKYIKATMTKEQIQEMNQNMNPKEMIKEFKSYKYKELGTQTIDGFEAEVIEIDDPNFMAGVFEVAVGKLWIDIESQLPARIEIEASSAGGQTETKIIAYDFDWLSPIEPEIFEPDIPADYALHGEVDVSNNEAAAVKGLRLFAEITDGLYPSNLDIFTASSEAQEVLVAKLVKEPNSITDPNMPITKEQLEKLTSIQAACLFYATLVEDEKDPVYYGEKVTPENIDMPLLRWKVSDSEYRVIFGDLRAENVSVDVLAELESEPDFIAVIEAPRRRSVVRIADTFVGRQEDIWHITDGDKIVAYSDILITAWPLETQPMQINLPYKDAALQSAKFGEVDLAFSMLDEGTYDIELDFEQLDKGPRYIKIIWSIPLEKLEKTEIGYRTVLKSLLSVFSYKLSVILEPNCGYENSRDTELTEWMSFSWNNPNPFSTKSEFGSCVIAIRKPQ